MYSEEELQNYLTEEDKIDDRNAKERQRKEIYTQWLSESAIEIEKVTGLENIELENVEMFASNFSRARDILNSWLEMDGKYAMSDKQWREIKKLITEPK